MLLSPGGDCCKASCKDNKYKCGSKGFSCLSGLDYAEDGCEVAHPEYLGDDYCDNRGNYNTKQCGWDLGDCCMDTCGKDNKVRNYCQTQQDSMVCRNPESKNYDASACPVTHKEYLGDGACDTTEYYNTEGCDWDGGLFLKSKKNEKKIAKISL